MEKYELMWSGKAQDIEADAKIYRHRKTGALVVTLKNQDPNRGLLVALRTPPKNDKGIPHILEHSVLCGSERFPLKDPFVQLMKGTLNTYLNAMTYAQYTVYPVSSPNLKEFMSLRSVYLNAIFFPLLRHKREIFMQEGWHYDCDETGKYTFNGVVFNEMKGEVAEEDFVLAQETARSLFPETDAYFVSGGLPEAIVHLSYEELMQYYQKYYHPGNAVFFYYGDLDITKELTELHEHVLCHFSYQPAALYAVQSPFSKMRQVASSYPVATQNKEEKLTTFSLNYVCEKLSYLDQLAFLVLSDLAMDTNNGFLHHALHAKGIGESYEFFLNTSLSQPVLSIVAHKCDPKQQQLFYETCMQSLKKACTEGFDQKMIASIFHELHYHFLADDNDASKAISSILRIVESMMFFRENPLQGLNVEELLPELRQALTTGKLEQLVKHYILENTHASYVVLQPNYDGLSGMNRCLQTLAEERSSSFDKAAKEHIDKMNQLLQSYQKQEDSFQALASIPLLHCEDLGEDYEKEKTEYGVWHGKKTLFHDLKTHGISYLRLLFPLRGLSLAECQQLSLWTKLLKYVDTAKHSYNDLDTQIRLQCGGIYASILPSNPRSSSSKEANNPAFLCISVCYLQPEQENCFALLKEVLYESLFCDKQRCYALIDELCDSYQSALLYRGDAFARLCALASFSPYRHYEEKMNGYSFYEFLQTIRRKKDYDFTILTQTAKKVLSSGDALLDFVGDREAWLACQAGILSILSESKKEENVSYPLVCAEKMNRGYLAHSSVQYCALAVSGEMLGIEDMAHMAVLMHILETDYLWQQIRVLGGAYGCGAFFENSGDLVFTSYRDPQLLRTLEIFRSIPEYVKNFHASSEVMTQYVIGAIKNDYMPSRVNQKTMKWCQRYLNGFKQEEHATYHTAMLKTTAEDIRCLAPYLRKIFAQECYAVIGNEENLKQVSFDQIKEYL